MEFITKNTQKKVLINRATFKEASRLKKEVLKCVLDLDGVDLTKIQANSQAQMLDIIIKLLVAADTSDGLESALFDCLKHCLYNDFHAITEQFFNDAPEAIEDYYEIASKCIEFNLRPFGKSLVTEYKARLAQINIELPE